MIISHLARDVIRLMTSEREQEEEAVINAVRLTSAAICFTYPYTCLLAALSGHGLSAVF